MDDNRWHRTLDEHRAAVMATARRLPAETVSLPEAVGRVLAEAVVATVSVPPAAVSAMDGFAVRHADVRPGAVLPVTMDVPAGTTAPHPLAPGTAARIMTGAPVPAGADTVVAVELTDVPRGPVPLPDRVTLQQSVPFADAVRDAGSDVRAGALVLSAGARVTPLAVGALAAVGCAQVRAVGLPRVRVVSTGAELRAPGQPLGPGQIHDSNSFTLAALTGALGLPCERVSVHHDDPGALATALPGLLDGADALVFTGGVSAGAFEVVRQTLAEQGVEFGTVAMQPGKPQGFGLLGGAAVFCLPGNPVSAVVSFALFVAPWLEAAAGRVPTEPTRLRAEDAWTKKRGRAQVMPVVRTGTGGFRRASELGSQSHLVTRLAGVDGFALVAAETEAVREGDALDVLPVPGGTR